MPDSPNWRQGEFCWYEIATRDPAAAKTFYSKLLGVTTHDSPMPGDGGTYTMVQVGGQDVAGLFELAGPGMENVPPHWGAYVWVDDVDATAARAQELGGQVMVAAMDIPGVGRMAVLTDPTGATVSVFHGSGHPGSARLGFAQGAVGWNELVTPDAAAASAFYTALFGWGTSRQDMPGGGQYTTFKVGDDGVAGMMQMDGPQWEGVPPHWMQYVNVDDCAAAADRARSLGATVAVEPTQVPDIGTFAVLQDPTGAHFSIMSWSLPDH